MRVEWGTEDEASRHVRQGEENDAPPVDDSVGQFDQRTLWDDLGYVGSVLLFIVGVIGLLGSLGGGSLAVLLGAVGSLPWILLSGLLCVALLAIGGFGMGTWDYYGRPPPK